MPGVIFKRIVIGEIGVLDTGWAGVSLNLMSNFSLEAINKKGFFDKESLDYWSLSLYGKKASEDVVTMRRLMSFKKGALSIYHKGYLTFLDRPFYYKMSADEEHVWLLLGEFRTEIHSFLPRIRYQSNKLTTDDGRHRLAVLGSLGVEYTPMVEVDVLPPDTKENDWNSMLEYGNILMGEMEKFRNSKEWKNYKTTKCYKKVAPKI